MISAFEAISQKTRDEQHYYPEPPLYSVTAPTASVATRRQEEEVESETEDEEVKLSCMGGFRGGDESDMNTSFASSEEEEEEEEEQEEGDVEVQKRKDTTGPLMFVSSHKTAEPWLVRPKASPPNAGPLSPHAEEGEEEEADTEDSDEEEEEDDRSLSGGARGVPIAVETESTASFCDDMEELEEEETEQLQVVMPNNEEEDDDDDESSIATEETEEEESQCESLEEEGQEAESNAQSLNVEHLVPEESSLVTDKDMEDVAYELRHYDDEEEASEMMIGVSQDRAPLSKSKRTLSSTELCERDGSESLVDSELQSPKKRKGSIESETSLPLLPFSLGQPAQTLEVSSPNGRSLQPVVYVTFPSSSDEDEKEFVLDGQLKDELDGYQSESGEDRDNSPVPLLTPPSSPLMFTREEGGTVVCEWPSGLISDNALTAVLTSEIRPILSPVSMSGSEDFDLTSKSHPSTLTPLLQGMVVKK